MEKNVSGGTYKTYESPQLVESDGEVRTGKKRSSLGSAVNGGTEHLAGHARSVNTCCRTS